MRMLRGKAAGPVGLPPVGQAELKAWVDSYAKDPRATLAADPGLITAWFEYYQERNPGGRGHEPAGAGRPRPVRLTYNMCGMFKQAAGLTVHGAPTAHTPLIQWMCGARLNGATKFKWGNAGPVDDPARIKTDWLLVYSALCHLGRHKVVAVVKGPDRKTGGEAGTGYKVGAKWAVAVKGDVHDTMLPLCEAAFGLTSERQNAMRGGSGAWP